jgi:hypothetical protein
MRGRSYLGSPCAALILNMSLCARADEIKPARTGYAGDLSGGIHVGYNWAEDPGWAVGLRGLLRYGVLEAGGQFGMGLTDSDIRRSIDEALLLGLGFQLENGLRFDVLGVLGFNMLHSAPHWTVDDPGTMAFLGYGGAQLGVSWRFGPPGVGHFTVGLVGLYEENFLRPTVHYEYSREAPDGTTTSEMGEHRFGERRIGVRVVLGMSFDLYSIAR